MKENSAKTRTYRAASRAIVSAALMICALGMPACAPTNTEKSQTITIGWTAWDDAEFVSRLAQTLIEQHTDLSVRLKLASIRRQYQGVANGDMDVMMMAWLPDTHAQYWAQARGHVVDLGTLYQHARLGWAVPDYIPADTLSSIGDLHKAAVQAQLNGRIQGIDPGAGLMHLSHQALADYKLKQDYALIPGDARHMADALKSAIEDKRWIVVTTWQPHPMLAEYGLRFLADPKNSLGKPQHVDVLARQGFANDYPRVASALSRMHIPLKTLQQAMFDAQQHGYDQAIAHFINNNQPLIQRWFDERPGRSSAAPSS